MSAEVAAPQAAGEEMEALCSELLLPSPGGSGSSRGGWKPHCHGWGCPAACEPGVGAGRGVIARGRGCG